MSAIIIGGRDWTNLATLACVTLTALLLYTIGVMIENTTMDSFPDHDGDGCIDGRSYLCHHTGTFTRMTNGAFMIVLVVAVPGIPAIVGYLLWLVFWPKKVEK